MYTGIKVDNNMVLVYADSMTIEMGKLEPTWLKYLNWCQANGLNPDFSDFTVWVEDQDMRKKIKVLDEWLIEGKYSD